MPYIEASTYRAPLFFKNRHLLTVYPTLFRKVPGVHYQRKRITTPDDDFLDLDWSKVGSKKVVVVLHGLEGNADRHYVRGMVKAMNAAGWDAVGMNFRGCSGESNRQMRYYHSGETMDLDFVLHHAILPEGYQEVAIVGFSLGGNVTLKYVGERGRNLDSRIRKAVGISVTIHLESSSYELAKWRNKVYMYRFLQTLKEKVHEKKDFLDDRFDLDAIAQSKSFLDFDEYFTAPAHGFTSARDYWTQSSSLQYLPDVAIPVLLINAQDDSFLSPQCHPVELARKHRRFYFENPKRGGHVGFVSPDQEGHYWTERRVRDFLGERP